MKFDEDFTIAIKNLPVSEKDKLLLRLLKKDPKTATLLYSKLVDTRSLEERREDMRDMMASKLIKMTDRYFDTLGYLMMDMRYLSGDITEYVRLNKDKYAEVMFNLYMLTEVLKSCNEKIVNSPGSKSVKLLVYIVARTFKLLVLSTKLHEDYYLELEPEFQKLGRLFGENPPLMNTAIHHGLDVNWLMHFDIPEDIETIQKELRLRGYLK